MTVYELIQVLAEREPDAEVLVYSPHSDYTECEAYTCLLTWDTKNTYWRRYQEGRDEDDPDLQIKDVVVIE